MLRALVDAFDAATGKGERCALATIVRVAGSSYRRAGARMLLGEDGTGAGSISPGCLERDVMEQARCVVQTGVPTLLEYETASTDSELPWALGMGCGGSIRVLVEPLAPESSYAAALRLACDERRNAFGVRVTTVYEHESVAHVTELIPHDGALADVAVESVDATQPGVLVETFLPPVPLIVFGAGPDAVPLVELARRLGWQTEVVDPQARRASHLRFPMADRVTLARPGNLGDHVRITPRTMAVVMSHDYSHDLAVLGYLLATPARYIGVMGPSRRTQRMLQTIEAPDEASLARVHAPAGLDIGAEGPEEIALSIVAEMRAVLNGRRGGMLRDRLGGIHGHEEQECAAAASAP